MDHAGALCGGCPSSAQQGTVGNLWPAQQTMGAGGVPGWPGQTAAQNAPQPPPPPCWTGQPNTACWSGAQPASYPASYPASVQPQASYPASVQPQASYPASFPAQVPSQALGPAQTVAPGSAPVPSPSPGSAHPCQPCWSGAPQYQPQPQPLPLGPAPAPTPVPVPAPAPGAHTSSVPGWVPPTPPSWPYNPGQPGWPGQNPTLMPPHWPLPPTSGPLSVPYNLNLSRGVYDKMMITIMGHVRPDAKMFTVNFLRGNDIAFHINPRFNEGGKQVFVRNHKCGERWGPEERSLKSSFPFAPGSAFEMKILCTHEEFRVAVNNIALFEFRHRIRELNQIDRINILHDVVLTYVNVETLP